MLFHFFRRCVQCWTASSENINVTKTGVVVEHRQTKWGLLEVMPHPVAQTEQQLYHSSSTSIRNRRKLFSRPAHWHVAQLKPFLSTRDAVFSTTTIKEKLVHGTLKTESKVSLDECVTKEEVHNAFCSEVNLTHCTVKS